jgi:hypothetical protein
MSTINWPTVVGVVVVVGALFSESVLKFFAKRRAAWAAKKDAGTGTAPVTSDAKDAEPYAGSRAAASVLVTALLADKQFALATQATQLASQIGQGEQSPAKPPVYTGTK